MSSYFSKFLYVGSNYFNGKGFRVNILWQFKCKTKYLLCPVAYSSSQTG